MGSAALTAPAQLTVGPLMVYNWSVSYCGNHRRLSLTRTLATQIRCDFKQGCAQFVNTTVEERLPFLRNN